jgi:hypothetical protein
LAAAVAVAAARGDLSTGAGGLGSLAPNPGALLAQLADRGVKVAAFIGS